MVDLGRNWCLPCLSNFYEYLLLQGLKVFPFHNAQDNSEGSEQAHRPNRSK